MLTFVSAVPYHQDIYLESGYGSVDIKANHAIFTEYQMAQRATIFRREEGGIFDMQSMEYVMRQNGELVVDDVKNLLYCMNGVFDKYIDCLVP